MPHSWSDSGPGRWCQLICMLPEQTGTQETGQLCMLLKLPLATCWSLQGAKDWNYR